MPDQILVTSTPGPTGSGGTTPEPRVIEPADPRRPAVLAVWRAVEERYPASMPVNISTLPSPAEYAQAVMEEVLRQGWQPPDLSPAPDTEVLRQQVEAYVAGWLNGYSDDFPALWGDLALKLAASLTEDVIGPLSAERDEALGEVRKLGFERYRLRQAARSGARTIPDDAAEQVHAAVLGVAHSWPTLADAITRQVMRTVQSWYTPKLAALFSKPDPWATPTTDPAPAAAGRPRWVQRGLHHHRCAVRAGAADCTCGVEPAAPQAPAEPTEETAFGALLAAAGDLDGGTDADRRLAEHIRSAVAEVAREDAATPPLPLQDQADLLTWRVVHVPPGTTDREDTDTPITPGWWLVGHGEDPNHPDVQVHLGDRLPTSSAATPAGGSHEVEVTVQDDGWATAECRTCMASIGESAEDTVQDWADRHRADTLRPGRVAPIQPEEA